MNKGAPLRFNALNCACAQCRSCLLRGKYVIVLNKAYQSLAKTPLNAGGGLYSARLLAGAEYVRGISTALKMRIKRAR